MPQTQIKKAHVSRPINTLADAFRNSESIKDLAAQGKRQLRRSNLSVEKTAKWYRLVTVAQIAA